MQRLSVYVLPYAVAVLVGVVLTLIFVGFWQVLPPSRWLYAFSPGFLESSPSPQLGIANMLAEPDRLEPFRSAGLALRLPHPITVDSPCYLPDVLLADAYQFTGESVADTFCLMRFSDLDSRDRVWQAFSGRTGVRVTVHGGDLLVYLGSSPALAYRYEGIFATLP